MRVGGCARLVLGAWLACGCGGGGEEQPVDAAPPDGYQGLCPVPPGFSHVMTQLRFDPAVGRDLDGDEEIDNAIGNLPSLVLGQIHAGFDHSIATGEWMMILHLSECTNPPAPTDPEVGFHLFTGLDADVPADPSNNYGGEGRFFIRVDEFDLDCSSNTEAEEAVLVDRVLSARNDNWSFPIAGGVGSMTLINGRTLLTYSDDFRTAVGEYTGMTTMCSMSQLPFPGETTGSVLDAFVNGLESFISADMDLDGDGLESVVGDGETVLECVDGDGTVIAGPECPCDARIADGYSAGFTMQSIVATVVGVK